LVASHRSIGASPHPTDLCECPKRRNPRRRKRSVQRQMRCVPHVKHDAARAVSPACARAWRFVPGRVRHRHFATETMRVKAHRAPCKDLYVYVCITSAFIYATFILLPTRIHAWFRPPPIAKHVQVAHILSLSLSFFLCLPLSPFHTLSLTPTVPLTLSHSVSLPLARTHMHTRTLIHCLPCALQLILLSFFSQSTRTLIFVCLESTDFHPTKNTYKYIGTYSMYE